MFNFILLAETFWEKPSGFGVPIGVVFLIWWAVTTMNNNNNSSNNLVNKALNDNKVSTGNVHVYYSSTVEKHKASKVLNYFSNFKNGDFHIEKANRYYTVKMVCKEGLWLDQDIINQAKEILQELKRDVFCTDSVDFHLCNDELVTKRVII